MRKKRGRKEASEKEEKSRKVLKGKRRKRKEKKGQWGNSISKDACHQNGWSKLDSPRYNMKEGNKMSSDLHGTQEHTHTHLNKQINKRLMTFKWIEEEEGRKESSPGVAGIKVGSVARPETLVQVSWPSQSKSKQLNQMHHKSDLPSNKWTLIASRSCSEVHHWWDGFHSFVHRDGFTVLPRSTLRTHQDRRKQVRLETWFYSLVLSHVAQQGSCRCLSRGMGWDGGEEFPPSWFYKPQLS